MRYRITEHDGVVKIELQQTGTHNDQLLDSFDHCRHGQCACPTDQYTLIEDMNVELDDDELTINLRPREGQRLDPADLQACLDFTIAHAQNQSSTPEV